MGIRFEAIRVFETPDRLPEDEVAIISFQAEGLRVAFLGDLGHPLSDSEAAPIRGTDVLLVPAGGRPTIDLDDVPELIRQLEPRWVLPMHYLTPRINLKLRPVEEFVARLPGWEVEQGREFVAEGGPRIVILDHLR